MCIAGEYSSTTRKRVYKAFRYFTVTCPTALSSVYYGGIWRTAKRGAPSISAYTNGNKGLHSLRTLKAARKHAGKHAGGGGRVCAQVEVSGKVAVFKRRGKVYGYLSTRQEIKRIYLARYQASYAPALRKRYKVPVSVAK